MLCHVVHLILLWWSAYKHGYTGRWKETDMEGIKERKRERMKTDEKWKKRPRRKRKERERESKIWEKGTIEGGKEEERKRERGRSR
jgi:hypothetical protein